MPWKGKDGACANFRQKISPSYFRGYRAASERPTRTNAPEPPFPRTTKKRGDSPESELLPRKADRLPFARVFRATKPRSVRTPGTPTSLSTLGFYLTRGSNLETPPGRGGRGSPIATPHTDPNPRASTERTQKGRTRDGASPKLPSAQDPRGNTNERTCAPRRDAPETSDRAWVTTAAHS